MTTTQEAYDDVAAVAHALAHLGRPLLLGTDVDGTLSPIVARPDDARLAPGALDALSMLDADPSVTVAVVSGRPLVELVGQFGLPTTFHLVGSHGAEFGTSVSLDAGEQGRLDEVRRILGGVAADTPGAHLEEKPVAAALHVRGVEADLAPAALARARADLSEVDGITVHNGHCVLEAAVRVVNKTVAVALLRERVAPATVVFIGDDASDEAVFASLTGADVAVKVGPGATVARWRLSSPLAVVELLALLAGGRRLRSTTLK